MVCPRCRAILDQELSGTCPNCGMPYARTTTVVMKTSAVLIAAGDGPQVYPSVADVPTGLRRALQESTNGANAATILIADRRGKEEIARALERIGESEDATTPVSGHRLLGLSWRNWIGVAIGFATGAAAWLLLSHHW
jgi:hypothetical protein